MGVDAVRADGENLSVQRKKLLMNSGDRRQLGRSDEGEIAGIEKQDDPASPVIFQTDLLNGLIRIVIGFSSKMRRKVIRLRAKREFPFDVFPLLHFTLPLLGNPSVYRNFSLFVIVRSGYCPCAPKTPLENINLGKTKTSSFPLAKFFIVSYKIDL